MKYTKIEDAIKRLEELSNIEGTELGESWQFLLDLRSYNYCYSPEFNVAVITEIFKEAEESHKHFEIIEEEFDLPHKQKVLRRIDE